MESRVYEMPISGDQKDKIRGACGLIKQKNALVTQKGASRLTEEEKQDYRSVFSLQNSRLFENTPRSRFYSRPVVAAA